MGLVTRDQLTFNPLDQIQQKSQDESDNLISIWTNTMVEIRDHAFSRKKRPPGSKILCRGQF